MEINKSSIGVTSLPLVLLFPSLMALLYTASHYLEFKLVDLLPFICSRTLITFYTNITMHLNTG